MSLRVITFDLDNTLWDVEPALLRAEEAQRRWLLEHRPGTMENVGHDELWELKKRTWKAHPELAHHISDFRRLVLRELQEAAGYGKAEAQKGAELAFEVFLEERQRVELYSEALGVLETLAEHYQLGALTNGNADVYKTDAGEYFDFAFLAEDVGASKPAAPLFEAALKYTGVEAREVLHVGDNPEHDVLGALNAGMNSAWYNRSGASWTHDWEPHVIVTLLEELPAAAAGLRRKASPE